jgi:hypothetical protein
MSLNTPNLFGRGPTQRGYMYLADDSSVGSISAAPGEVVRVPDRKPPWLVVDHALWTVLIARWPGRLWLVEILDSISAAEQKALGSVLRSDAPYTRAAAVRFIEDMGLAALFGERGAAVCSVIETARGLTEDIARRLTQARHEEAGQAYSRVWHRWLEQQRVPAADQAESFAGVIAIPSRPVGRPVSPVGRGLMVIADVLGKRAEALVGASAWIEDANDPDGAFLVQPWAGAEAALCTAALAFGAPDLMSETDRDILAKAWRDVIGPEPDGALPTGNQLTCESPPIT